jgi:hypothetical protein
MPSHTFTRLGQWEQSIATNRRSIDVAVRGGAIGEAAHASDYMEYAYLQLGRDSAAFAIVQGLPTLVQRFDANAVTGAAPPNAAFFAFAAIPARYALERRDWARAAALPATSSPFPWTEAMVYFARALGAAHVGDTAGTRVAVDSLGAIHERLRASGEGYWAEQVAIQQLGAYGWLQFVQGARASAVASMTAAATREDATEKSAVTPGPLAPARELLGDMFMELRRPADALREYSATLTREPNRFRALYGAMRACDASGDTAGAARYRTALRALLSDADVPGRPELREIRPR